MFKNLTREVKAIIFDIDNTLIATDKFVIDNIKKTATRLRACGMFDIRMPIDEEIIRVQAKNLPFEEIFQELFPGEKNEQNLWEVVLAKYREHAPNEPYEATPGAVQAVQKLIDMGFVVGLVTNRFKMIEDRLTQAGFDTNNFSFMCTPPAKEFSKPHPRAFEEAIEILQTKGIQSEQTIMFGDHPDDYYSSFYQNIKFVAVLQGRTTREDFRKIKLEDNLIVENLTNIENTIENVIKVDHYKKSLYSTSALDGRHKAMSYPLRHYFSEYALHKYRVMAEIEHIIALSEYTQGQVVRILTGDEKKLLQNLYLNFSEASAYEVLQYDHLGRNNIGPTEHDVKSCELWIKEKLKNTSLEDVIPMIHVFVTSADINNLAYKSMLSDAIKEIFIPETLQITDKLKKLTQKYLDAPVMGRTHVQPASPTTFGKIFGGYLTRLTKGLQRLQAVKLTGKINGAVGNYNTFLSAYPDVNWKGYSKYLCNKFNFETEMWTDQRGTHADMIAKFQAIQEIGNVIQDFAQDMSLYAAFGTMYFSKVESHVGSSVMPHKINPWFAEVTEGGIKKANGLINTFASQLDVSRLQRDLSDHEYERSYGEAFGYVIVAMKHLQIALDLIRPDVVYAKQELENHPQIVTEAIQTILRKHGRSDAYELIKKEVRGKKVTIEELRNFVTNLAVEDKVKQEIMINLDPTKYTGLASSLARDAVEYYENFINSCA